MLEAVVRHYQYNQAIFAWQLENEPFFDAFGVCPESDEEFFKRELELVKKIDSRPVMVSATGELSFLQKEAKYGDIFGSTVYRVVWGPYTSYIRYPIPAWFYRFKAYLAGIDQEDRYVVELQAEPWVPNGRMIYLSSEEEAKSFGLRQFILKKKTGILFTGIPQKHCLDNQTKNFPSHRHLQIQYKDHTHFLFWVMKHPL